MFSFLVSLLGKPAPKFNESKLNLILLKLFIMRKESKSRQDSKVVKNTFYSYKEFEDNYSNFTADEYRRITHGE